MRNFVRKIKLTIINDVQAERLSQYQILRDYQYNTWKLANKIVQGQFFLKVYEDMLLYKYPETYKKLKMIEQKINQLSSEKTKEAKESIKILYQEKNNLKKLHQEEFEVFLRNQSIQNFTYGSNADEFRELLPGTIRTTLNSKVFGEFKNKMKDFMNGSASVQTYKRTIPVPFQKSAINDFKKEEDGSFTFVLFKIKFKCLLGKDLNNTTHILDDIINQTGQFQMGDSAYCFDGKDLYLISNFKTEEIKDKRNTNIVAGVDLGVTRMATLIIRDITANKTSQFIERKFYGDESFMKKIQYLNNKGSNISRYSLGKTGKGRLHAIGKKQQFKEKIGNFRDNFNKKITHQIIQRCVANNVSSIVLEDLSGIGELNQFMKNWPYFDLQMKIKHKAYEYGIEVTSIAPDYSSQTCSNCGHVCRENRIEQKSFQCVECEYKANADVNAAINLVNFSKGITSQKIRKKNTVKLEKVA